MVRRMLGDIGRGAPIFAAQRQALEQAKEHEDDRRGDPDRGVAGQQADQEGRQPHDAHCHEEGVLAPDQVADPPEQDRPERSHREARGEGGEREDETGRLVDAREELRGDDRGEQPVEVEIIPFEHGAERGCGDDQLLALCGLMLLGHGCGRHAHIMSHLRRPASTCGRSGALLEAAP